MYIFIVNFFFAIEIKKIIKNSIHFDCFVCSFQQPQGGEAMEMEVESGGESTTDEELEEEPKVRSIFNLLTKEHT